VGVLPMIKIDEESIFREIKERKAVSVALNAPDGLLPKVQETASKIMKRFGIPAYVLADTTWGSCDLNSNGGIKVKIGKGKGQLNDGQVFGCEFYPASETKETVDVNVFLGQSNFHAAGIALSTNKPTYVLDPYFNEIREVTEFANKLQRKATLAIYKAAEAKTFGIIVGLKEGQLSKLTALKFKRELEKEGKEVQLFALTNITNERLQNIKGIDAFIQVACPRISTDNQFDKPLLSTPQATALLKILRNESIDGYLQIPHWL